MHTVLFCLATTLVGVEVGWQRIPEGGMEYIIQLDPQTLESLRAGQTVQSDIPPNAGDVRSYRIVAGAKGSRVLPRDTPPPELPNPAPETPSEPKASPANPPPPLLPEMAGRLLPEHQAVFMKPTGTDIAMPVAATEAAAQPPAKPWFPLTFALLGLFASLGANVFLTWIVWDCRKSASPDALIRSQKGL
jgi:hypothetical protein